MACDEQLVQRIREALAGAPGTGERRMFGGVCFTLNGNMICGVVKDEIMVRVGAENYLAALQRPHARKMDFTGRPMNGYVFVAKEGFRSDSSLSTWTDWALAFGRTLPAKAPRRSKKLLNR